MSIDADTLMRQYADGQNPFSLLDNQANDAQRMMAEQVALRDELVRMVKAVAATEAGRYMFAWLAETYVLKGHYSPDLSGGIEAVALRGTWSTAQAEVVQTLLALAAHTVRADDLNPKEKPHAQSPAPHSEKRRRRR